MTSLPRSASCWPTSRRKRPWTSGRNSSSTWDRCWSRYARERGVAPMGALFPFVLNDPDFIVISTASLHLAQLMPLEDGDPLTGPRTLLEMAAELREPQRQVAILAGLTALGDEEVFELLEQSWWGAGREAQVDVVACMGRQTVTTAAIEFLVTRLERWIAEGHGGADRPRRPDPDSTGAARRRLAGLPARLRHRRLRHRTRLSVMVVAPRDQSDQRPPHVFRRRVRALHHAQADATRRARKLPATPAVGLACMGRRRRSVDQDVARSGSKTLHKARGRSTRHGACRHRAGARLGSRRLLPRMGQS